MQTLQFVRFVLQAYVDLVRAWGWKSFTIIYENNEGLVRLQELLKAHGPYEFPITVRQLGETPDYRYVFIVIILRYKVSDKTIYCVPLNYSKPPLSLLTKPL